MDNYCITIIIIENLFKRIIALILILNSLSV